MKIINYILIFMLCLPFAFAGAFSTPYLDNNTIYLNNASPTYSFEIVFQNPSGNETTMMFDVEKGKEWFDKQSFKVIIPPNTFDKKEILTISKPEFARFNKAYDISFFITETQIKEGPITAAGRIVKTYQVIFQKDLNTYEKCFYWFTDNAVVCMIVVIIILVLGTLCIIYLYKHFIKKKEPEVTQAEKDEFYDNVNKELNEALSEDESEVKDAEFEDKEDKNKEAEEQEKFEESITPQDEKHICTMNGEKGECSICGKKEE